MGFTTQFFLFVYFPLAVMGIAICRWLESRLAILHHWRLAEWALAAGSLCFYGWALFDGIYQLFCFSILLWGLGKLIQVLQQRRIFLLLSQERGGTLQSIFKISCPLFVIWTAVFAILILLFRFKYMDFAAFLWQTVFRTSIQKSNLLAPLGISFISFSAISYLVDIYRAPPASPSPAGSFLDCLLYLSFFPKVISGPIVLWKDFKPQLSERRIYLDDISSGLERIMIGFTKKLILADVFGACVADIQSNASSFGIDTATAWGAVLLYMLQIYYDFAGYSDIAIGLSRLFGFHFKENFNFPYRSFSITEFWRRWHISLGTWFREYVYIPMGGSRLGTKRTLWNLAVVFALTGIWHGAGWNYIIWGAINGFFIILERIIRDESWYQKIPKSLKWAGTMSIVMMFWELFRFQSITELKHWLDIMLGVVRYENYIYTVWHFFDARMIFLTIVAILGATVFGMERIQKFWVRFCGTTVGFAIREAGAILLFILAILFMVNSAYSPFIYFQY